MWPENFGATTVFAEWPSNDWLIRRREEAVSQCPAARLTRSHIQLDVPFRTDRLLGGPKIQPSQRVVRCLLHSNLRSHIFHGEIVVAYFVRIPRQVSRNSFTRRERIDIHQILAFNLRSRSNLALRFRLKL